MGWTPFKKSCYKISKYTKQWAAAKRKCEEMGGHLLKIDDQPEQDYFRNEFFNKSVKSVGKINGMRIIYLKYLIIISNIVYIE